MTQMGKITVWSLMARQAHDGHSMNLGLDLLMRAYYGVIDPLIVRRRKLARLQDWQAGNELPTIAINLQQQQAAGHDAAEALQRFKRVAMRYDMRFDGQDEVESKRRATPMLFDLQACQAYTDFEAILRQHSNRTLPKIRKAQRMHYSVRQFALPEFVHDLHAVKTSMKVRSGGPVMAHWLLKPEDMAQQSAVTLVPQQPSCPTHWTIWLGVFLPEPGHHNGILATNERLVCYLKLTRCGEVVHYLDIMGHKDHLENGVMMLLHAYVVERLQEAQQPVFAGVKAIWYGALEHGVIGLTIWKKRAGFVPLRVRLQT